MNPAQLKALKHIKSELDAGRLGAMRDGTCIYEDEATGKHCAIGCLLSRDTLDEIHNEGWNEDLDVRGLFNESEHIRTQVPFTETQAAALQTWHDQVFTANSSYIVAPPTRKEFSEILDLLIAEELTQLGTSPYSKLRVGF